ncbi:HEAT repeat-containing protein [Haladaptatus litoreus]|uniref:HEAT repeat-containing protein n=1 Tax=Haladaptatus litoreus TaxID=553468 RepID=A0A1N6V502_9EURY|nr:HEAT repeat domain-containing protein [Haladaptatus litoreus]SIQ72945.1 HEAT repeat-containing protein [Haladaptatus litoreus]
MDDSTHSTDYFLGLIEQNCHDEATEYVERVETAPAEERKETVRALRSLADDDPSALKPLVPTLSGFLTDDERSVRLTMAKLLVAIAETDPDTVVPAVPALGERLADDEEFYYVRARSAEALGYVAREHPDAVASPEVVADLQVGLSFDEPEVKEKLAKALEHIALGDPTRLKHQVSTLATHLDDESELVRYHLCTTLVVVGCESPESVADATDSLTARLDDESAHVRGRAAEALGVLASANIEKSSVPASFFEEFDGRQEDDEPFARRRKRFVLEAVDEVAVGGEGGDEIGTVEGVRATTSEAVAEITATDGECPHCGLALPKQSPPMCSRCGGPH